MANTENQRAHSIPYIVQAGAARVLTWQPADDPVDWAVFQLSFALKSTCTQDVPDLVTVGLTIERAGRMRIADNIHFSAVGVIRALQCATSRS